MMKLSEEYKDCIIALKYGKGIRLTATGVSMEMNDKMVVVWDKSDIMAVVPFDEIRCVLFAHSYDPDELLGAIGGGS